MMVDLNMDIRILAATKECAIEYYLRKECLASTRYVASRLEEEQTSRKEDHIPGPTQ